MVQMSNQGLEFLIAEGITPQRTLTQEMVIGCLACRWKASEAQGGEPEAYAAQIAKCSGFTSGTVSNVLKRYEERGVIAGTRKVRSGGRQGDAVRVDYGPADTELGAAFRASLEAPEVCGLEDNSLLAARREAWRTAVDTRKATKAAGASRAEAARAAKHEARVNDLINTSSREQLEELIAQATARIEQLNNSSE